jgi:hypothetical protein
MASQHAEHGRLRTRWVGWIVFAGTLLILAGIVNIIDGVVALSRAGAMVVTESGTAVTLDYRGVASGFLILGVVLVVTGAGLMTGRTWARVAGIVLAAVSVLVNLAFFAAAPLWSAVIIIIDMVVIYAIAAHGRELRRAAH